MDFIEPCFGIGHNLSLICQMTSEDIKHQLIIIIILFVFALIILSVMIDWANKTNYLQVLFVFVLIILSVMVDCAFKISCLSMPFVFALPSRLTGRLKSVICQYCLSSP